MAVRILPLLAFLLIVGEAAAAEPSVRVRLLLSNPTPYVGEEVIETLEVRYRRHPGGRLTLRWPAPDGCLSDDFPPLLPAREETPEGSVLVEVARRRLIPLAPGRLELAGGILLQEKAVDAPAQSLRVRPLPAAGRPPGFTGAVGTVAMELEAAASGTREVALTLRGTAPLDAFPPPRVETGAGERLIPLDDTTRGEAGGERVRTLRYLFQPGDGRRGRLSFTLSLFDPAIGRYRLLRAALPGEASAWRRAGGTAILLLALASAWAAVRRRRGRSLESVLARALGQSPAGLSREQILAGLRRLPLEEPLVGRLERFWQAQDQARFAPAGHPGMGPAAGEGRAVAAALAKVVDKTRRIP